MKITVVGPTYPYKSGISHFTTILVGKLRQEHGADSIDFINWQRQYPGFLYPVDPIDTTSKQTIQEANVRLLDFYNPLSWIKTARRIKAHGSQRLIITWVSMAQTPPYLGLLLAVKAMTKARVTFLCHNVLPHDPHWFEKPFNKLMFRLADDFIVHSQGDAKDLAQLAPGKPYRLGFHPTYDDFNTGQHYDSDAIKQELGLKPKVVLFFGFIRKYKGLKDLITAMQTVKKTTDGQTSLLIVGEFWKHDKPEYQKLVDQYGLQDDVVFVDRFVPNEEVGKYFAAADLLVAPYHSATQSGVVQMAYAFDTPVVATNVGGLPDAVQEGVSGFLCAPHAPDDLAATIAKALGYSSYDLTATKQRFTWEAYITQCGLASQP